MSNLGMNKTGGYGSWDDNPQGQDGQQGGYGVYSAGSEKGAPGGSGAYGSQDQWQSFASEPGLGAFEGVADDITPQQTSTVAGCIGAIVFAVLIFGLIGFGIFKIYEANIPRVIFLNYVSPSEATIVEKVDDSGKLYIRVEVPNLSAPPDNMWVQVNREYYDKHNKGDRIGVLVGNYDVFRPGRQYGIFGKKTRKFEKTEWGIEEVYDNFDMAKLANPYKKYEVKGTVKDKKTTKDGFCYLLIDANGKSVKANVDKAIYDKYNVGDSVYCEFESYGDYVRYLGLKEEIPN